jgi:uncharacterized protein DUF1232
VARHTVRAPHGARRTYGPVGGAASGAESPAYAFSPIDLIPDFIPVLGHLDELVLLPLGIALTLRLIPAPVWAECRVRARAESAARSRAGWIAAGIIVLFWLLVIIWLAGQVRL